ncbi:LOW QUALITY PROTEIN: tonsoku-like protein [Falco peregrinus]|uniref:LOW QUALITY PROTEIN: tonsoku-like protein n=1 Tax=Falco peregrinus TaxID=8954 RepID=UPI00247A2A5A|nr:LOW QUALITY PROTEIN: tonsoku-like protein [Falco peregrinus]
MNAGSAREIRQLQKAKEKAQRSGSLVEEAAVCNQLGEILASHGRYEEALEEHRQELQLLEGAGDSIGCAVAHRKIGERLAELENYEAALKHQHQHLELARSLSDDTEQQRAWATIGRTYMFMADSRTQGEEAAGLPALRKAEQAFHTSLAIVEEKLEGAVPHRELTEMRTRLYLNLGLVYDSLKEPAKCDNYIKKSIFLSEQGQLYEDLYRAYFNLGSIHLREGEHSGALRCLARARDCARRMKEKGMESECCSSTAQVLLSLGDFAAAKRSLKQAYMLGSRQPWQRDLIRSNLRYATKVVRLQEALEEAAASDPSAALALCEQLGDTFSKHGDYGRAAEYYQRQLTFAQALGRPAGELAVIHVSLATTFGDLKDHVRAVHHYQQELALHQGNALEEGKTWLNMALAMEEVGKPRAELQPCFQTALERAEAAGDPRLQRQILQHLHLLQLRDGDTEAAAGTVARLEGLGGSSKEEEEEEEEELESSETQDESELELSESEGEEDELDGYSKSVPGRRRISKQWNRRNERGETPLHRACIEGDLRRVQLFLKQGHPLNPRDYCGWTPLHEACNHGHLEIVRLLLDWGAALDDPGGPGCEGITPLHDALSCGHFEVAELLVQRGASVTARNARGLTPLGTLEEWASTYSKELDQETRQQCWAAERLLREVAAGRAPPQLSQDSPLFDAECAEPRALQPCSPPVAEPGDSDMSPLRPVKKRQRVPGLGRREGADLESAEYEAAIRGLGSAKSLLGGSTMTACRQLAPRPALIPAEQYLEEDDWLEDDLGGSRGGRKRPRREPQEPAATSEDSTGPESDGRVPARAQHQPPAPPECAEPPHPPGGEDPTGALPGMPTPEAAGPPLPTEGEGRGSPPCPPTALPALRVRVRVQDNVFLIPVPQSESRAVGWLAERAAERYYQTCGLLPRLTLKKEGALLAPQDLVGDVLQSNEEVLAEVQCWDLPPLAERYRRACQSLAVEPHQLLLKVMELQEQSPGLGVGGSLALRPPHLPPLLRALKLQAPLRQLWLRACGLSDDMAADLLATLATLPALTLLDLAGNRLGAQGLRQLVPQHPGTFQSLEELDLSLNPLGDASCQPLALLLRHCPALTTLRLQACGFTDSFALDGAARLQTLSLSCNALGAAGLERLLGGLACHSLGRLELRSVTRPGLRPLTGALGRYLAQEGCALSHLTLSGNWLGDGDILEVARCLPTCPALASLDFSANPRISATGLRTLLSALEERSQGLEFLSLAGCSVEGPLDDTTWARAASQIQDLRLCSQHVRRSDQRDAGKAWHGPAGTALGTVMRHRKLFCKSS